MSSGDVEMRKRAKRAVRSGKSRRAPMSRMGLFAPSKLRVELRTAKIFHANSGAFAQDNLILNAAHNPFNESSGINQPRGFKQYEALYARAMVVSGKVVVKAVCGRAVPSTGVSLPDCVSFVIAAGSTPTDTKFTRLSEIPGAAQVMLPPGGPTARFQRTFDVKKMYGSRDLDVTDFSALTSASTTFPNRIIYGSLYTGSLDTTSIVNSYIIVTVTQVVEFFDSKSLDAEED